MSSATPTLFSSPIPYSMMHNIQTQGELDSFVIVKAVPHNNITDPRIVEEIQGSYLLYHVVQQNKDGDMCWVWKSVKNPQGLLEGSQWQLDAGENGPTRSFWHYRERTDASEAAKYHSHMRKGRAHIYIGGRIRQEAHLWEMDKPNTILPSTYYYVCSGRDETKEWCFKVPVDLRSFDLRSSASLGQPKQSSITLPKHVLHTFMEAAFAKSESCPITMDPLTKENCAYTACGHLFSHEAIVQCINTSGKCPNCRYNLGPLDICGY